MGMESCPQACTVVAGRAGLQPHHLTGFAMVPPCWATGPEGLKRAGGLQQVRCGGKSGKARKEREKDDEGEKRQGLKQKGREKTGTRQQRGGKTARAERDGGKKTGVDEKRGGRPGGRGGEAPR